MHQTVVAKHAQPLRLDRKDESTSMVFRLYLVLFLAIVLLATNSRIHGRNCCYKLMRLLVVICCCQLLLLLDVSRSLDSSG